MKPNTKKGIVKKRKQYSQANLEVALEEVKKGMSKKLASKTFNVPRGTIQWRLKKNCKALPGPNPVLTREEEDVLVKWIYDCCRKGFPRRKFDLQVSVASFIKKTGRKNPFKNGIPGKKWYDLFMRRHPELSERIPEAVTFASGAVSEQDVRDWFYNIEIFLKENHYFEILSDPSRIFNGDESNFQLCPKNRKVLALRGDKDVYEIDHAAAKSALTVLFNFGANGDITPPLVVFPNKRLPKEITTTVPGDWGIGLSDSGWMKADLFFDYIKNVFYPYLLRTQRKFPVILFVDGHKTHLSLEISELCKSYEIVLIAIYPNATRLLQPADVAAFRPLKVAWKDCILQWRRDHPLEILTKNNFVPVLKEALEKGIRASTVINGFRTTGLYPWNPDAINYKKCLGKGLKDASHSQTNAHSEKVITKSVLHKIIGEKKLHDLEKVPLSLLSESDKILKKVCNFFENTNDSMEIDQVNDTDRTEFANINNFPTLFLDTNEILTNEKSATKSSNMLENNLNEQNASYALTPIKIQDILIKQKTPEKKVQRIINRAPFVLTCNEWQKGEIEKINAKKVKEEQIETRKKIRVQKQEDRKNVTKNYKAKDSKQEFEEYTQPLICTDNFSQDQPQHLIVSHEVEIHTEEQENKTLVGTCKKNINSKIKELEFQLNKQKTQNVDIIQPEKKIKVLSDVKINVPFRPYNTKTIQYNAKTEAFERIIANIKKQSYRGNELENIFSAE